MLLKFTSHLRPLSVLLEHNVRVLFCPKQASDASCVQRSVAAALLITTCTRHLLSELMTVKTADRCMDTAFSIAQTTILTHSNQALLTFDLQRRWDKLCVDIDATGVMASFNI